MTRVFDAFMFRNELDVLQMRLEELEGAVDRHILVESAVTHRGVPKALRFHRERERFGAWPVQAVTADLSGIMAPWAREHAQRHAAWAAIDAEANDDDIILICDVDEIPSPEALAWRGPDAVAVQLRTCIFAVDWEIVSPIPPACVMVTARHARARVAEGFGLGDIRDHRGSYPVIEGGWHLSWLGGPRSQIEKLETATCHVEMEDTPEAELIRSGMRYAKGLDGGGHKVAPVEVDGSWPRFVRERRCPPSWFRPHEEEGAA